MDSDKFKLFISVAETGSMTKTAKEFFVTEQSVSKTIKSIESLEGKKLIKTSSRGSKLTEDGEKYYAFAKSFIEKEKDLLSTISQNKNSQLVGEINIGCVQAMLVNVVPEIIMLALKKYAKIKVNIHEDNSQGIINKVVGHEDDLGIIINNYTDKESSLVIAKELQYIKISDVNCNFWVNQNFIDQDYSKLNQYKIIIYNKYDVNGLIFLFKALCLNLTENFFYTDNIYLIKRLVQEGLAICPDINFGKKNIVFGELFKDTGVHSFHLSPKNYHSELAVIKQKNTHKLDVILKEIVQIISTNFND